MTTITETVVTATVSAQAVALTLDEQVISVTVSGAPGPQGVAGAGLPAGGTTGQALVKASDDDHDTAWAAGSDATYRHIQSVAAATWTVTHNLGKWPAVTVIDSSGRVVLGDVRYLSASAVEVSFSAAFAGEALCN